METITDKMFKPCREIPQCATADFTYNGAKVTRMVPDTLTGEMREHHPTDEIKCGSFAYLDNGKCVLDRVVLPLYVTLCEKDRSSISKHCNFPSAAYTAFSEAELSSHCANVAAAAEVVPDTDENENNIRIMSIVRSLNAISDLFQAPANVYTAEEYIYATECAEEVYAKVQEARSTGAPYAEAAPYQSGLYYVMRHILVEVRFLFLQRKQYLLSNNTFFLVQMPFGFWHKCLVLQGRTMHTSFDSNGLRTIYCPEWSDSYIPADQLNTTDYSTDTLAKLMRIDGGVRLNVLQASAYETMRSVASAADDYLNGGYSANESPDAWNPFSHPGVTMGYNQMCYARTSYVSKSSMWDECVYSYAYWVHVYNALPGAFQAAPGKTFSRGVLDNCWQLMQQVREQLHH